MKYFKIFLWPLIYVVGQLLILIIISNITSTTYVNEKPLIPILVTGIIFIPLLYKVYNKYNKKTKFNIKNIYEPILLGISVSLIFNITLYNINNLYHITNMYDGSNINIFILVLSSGIIGPIIEELLFRGIVYNELKEITKPMKAIIFTSILFSLFHSNIIDMIYAFGVSFMFIYLYEKYKDLKYSIVMHMSLNITILLFLDIIRLNNIIINSSLLVISLVVLILLRKLIK